MSRVITAMGLDWRLQWRNGFYAAAIVMVVAQVLAFMWLPDALLARLLPPILLGNLTINGFYFIAGLILLERAEGSLQAQVVTPLRGREYLLSKTMTLCCLSAIESLIIFLILRGTDFSVVLLLAGVVLATGFLCQFGFLVVARYATINEFLFPSFAWTTLLSVPYLGYFDIWQSWLLYLHPVTPLLVVLEAAIVPTDPARLAYGFAAATAWLALLFFFSVRTFARFVVRGDQS